MKVELVFRPTGSIDKRGYMSQTVTYSESMPPPEIGEFVAFKGANYNASFQVVSKLYVFSEDSLTIEYDVDLPAT